jgi:hypothetical protein
MPRRDGRRAAELNLAIYIGARNARQRVAAAGSFNFDEGGAEGAAAVVAHTGFGFVPLSQTLGEPTACGIVRSGVQGLRLEIGKVDESAASLR